MSSFSSNHGQTSKPRTKGKPKLRKLTQSERTSLDLDRPAEQDSFGGSYGGRSSQDHGGSGSGNGNGHGRNPRGYHRRNTSGTSQFSTDSGQRAGSFIHPFAQTPYARPYTPPVASSYQASLHESEHSNSLVPTPTEDEEQDQEPRRAFRSTSNLSQRAASSVNSGISPTVTTQPLLRIQTKQSQLASRLALATSNTSLNNYLSPLSPDIPSAIETSTSTPASNMRTSIENFRIRSHSHQDSSGSRQYESIADARRRFEESERARDEKAAQEEVRKLEKRNEREARKIEREHRRSSVSEGTRTKRSKSDLTMQSEKGGIFVGPVQDTSGLPANLPGTGGRQRSATFTAKKKTHSTWTKFMMWFRTRLLRMGNKKT